VKAGRDWMSLEAVLRRPPTPVLDLPGVVAKVDQQRSHFAGFLGALGVNVYEPDDLYTVLVSLEMMRVALVTAERNGALCSDGAVSGADVVRALAIMLAEYAPAEARL
jgi:hypothetical protein